VILDEEKRVVDAVAGDMILAHRAGAEKLNKLVSIQIPEVADIVVAGCSFPTSVNLYQSTNALLNCVRLDQPIVKKGGIIILASPCLEGIGGSVNFYNLISEPLNAQGILDNISKPGFFVDDQWAAQLWALVLQHAEIWMVTEGVTPDIARKMKAIPFHSVEEALMKALAIKGRTARVTVLSDSPYTIPRLNSD
jgi:nickel-dependent lactate racemase